MMERYLGQIWAVPSLVKPEGKKLKKKSKGNSGSTQRPYSVNYSDTKASSGHNNNITTKPQRSSLYFNIFGSAKSSATSQPSSPPPADSGHSRGWFGDFRENGHLFRSENRHSRHFDNNNNGKKTRQRAVSVAAHEFGRMAMTSDEPSRPLEVSSRPPVSNATCPTRRRYAKTPVLHIGQLEAHHKQHAPSLSQSVPRSESIAESYTALLESRNPYLSEAAIEDDEIPVRLGEPSTPKRDPSLMSSPIIQPVVDLAELPPRKRPSPRSDDGTLVASDEDPIDFHNNKNAPASSTPSSPSCSMNQRLARPGPESEKITIPTTPTTRNKLHKHIRHNSNNSNSTSNTTTTSTSTSSGNGSELKLCLDLLTKELLSTFNGSPSQSITDTSAFQIYLMIEAYEKLRDQVLQTHETGSSNDGPLRAMFDTWLKALHSVHDGMTGADGQGSESNYGD